MRFNYYLFILILGVILIANCSANSDEEAGTPGATIKEFFSLYEKDISGALSYLFSSNKWMKNSAEVTALNSSLGSIKKLAGNYIGYEELMRGGAANSMLIRSYMVKYERQPVRFTFTFYKPGEEWMIYNFKFDDKISEELQEADKLYLLDQTFQKE